MWTVLKFLLTKFQPSAQLQNSPKSTHSVDSHADVLYSGSIGHNRVTLTKSLYFATHILNEVAAIKSEPDIIGTQSKP